MRIPGHLYTTSSMLTLSPLGRGVPEVQPAPSVPCWVTWAAGQIAVWCSIIGGVGPQTGVVAFS
jgi:hypothetical protein